MAGESDLGPLRAAKQLAYELTGVPDRPTLFAAICQLIPQLIDCDEVVWDGGDVVYRWATFNNAHADRYGPELERLLLDVTDNPVRMHYFSGMDPNGRPVRIGDLTSDRQFRSTRAWAELYRPLGITRQLTIPTVVTSRKQTDGTSTVTGGIAWSLNRDGREFDDHDVAVATALQPLLRTLEADTMWNPGPYHFAKLALPGMWDRDEGSRTAEQGLQTASDSPLTARELEVLSLVAQRYTAVSIGFRLRISAATVRKHLEHIYAKTGQRDRLLAVAYAQRAGLLQAS